MIVPSICYPDHSLHLQSTIFRSFLVPVRIFVFIRSCLRVLKTVQTPNFLCMLIKLLVLPLFPFLHSSFQPFSFITSLPVYICPFHQSPCISVHIKLVCAPSPHSADKGRGTEISCIVVLMLVQVKNSKTICVFVISVCACCHREFIHPGKSNSLLTHH